MILFVFGLGALYLYQWRKEKVRMFPLSEQIYPELILTVLIIKQSGEIKSVILRVEAKKEMILKKILVDLISHENKFYSVALNDVIEENPLPLKLPAGKPFDFKLEMTDLKNEITGQSVKFNAFRLVAQNDDGKKFKSHRLAFNKRWSVFRPDTGKYN